MTTTSNGPGGSGPIQNRGWLKHGNPPGDPMRAPRCGARTRSGRPCRAPAMRGRKRCRMHGGPSRGPTSVAGLEKSRRARWKTGYYSRQAKAARKAETAELREQRRALMELIANYRKLR